MTKKKIPKGFIAEPTFTDAQTGKEWEFKPRKDAPRITTTKQFVSLLWKLDETIPELWTFKGRGIYSNGEEGINLQDIDGECEKDYLEGVCLIRNTLGLMADMIHKLERAADDKVRDEVAIMARNWIKEHTDEEGEVDLS